MRQVVCENGDGGVGVHFLDPHYSGARVPGFFCSGSARRDESLPATFFWGVELLKAFPKGPSAPLICAISGFHAEVQMTRS